MNDEVRARDFLGDQLWPGTPRGLDRFYIENEDDRAPKFSGNRRWKEASKSLDETEDDDLEVFPHFTRSLLIRTVIAITVLIVSALLRWASRR
jgi:hypothetical protein